MQEEENKIGKKQTGTTERNEDGNEANRNCPSKSHEHKKWDEHGMRIGDKMGNLDIDFTDQVVNMQDPLLQLINHPNISPHFST